MTHHAHKASAPASVTCYVVTVSDTRTEDTDTSGRAIADLLTDAGHVVSGRTIVKDDPDQVRSTIERQLANPDVQVIITTGGPGSPRATARGNRHRAAAQTASTVRRAVQDAELRRDRRVGDDEPCVRRPRRGTDHRVLAGIRSGGPPRDGKTSDTGARPPRARGIPVGSGFSRTVDSMRPFTSTISLDEARRRLDAAVVPIARIERVPLADAAGRVVAADVRSELDVPPFARSAMDGYAVVASDIAGASRATPVRLRIVERLYTGRMARETSSGACAEIATGAPLPTGADAVIPVETRRRMAAASRCFAAVTPRQHVGGADPASRPAPTSSGAAIC